MFLTVDSLNVTFKTRGGIVSAVRDVSFTLEKGETLGIVGESGSGKSVSSYAIMRILDRNGKIAKGSVTFDDMDLTAFSNKEMRELRGREISMVFQNPRAALNPIRKVGHQIEDVLRRHARATKYTAKAEAIKALEAVERAQKGGAS